MDSDFRSDPFTNALFDDPDASPLAYGEAVPEAVESLLDDVRRELFQAPRPETARRHLAAMAAAIPPLRAPRSPVRAALPWAATIVAACVVTAGAGAGALPAPAQRVAAELASLVGLRVSDARSVHPLSDVTTPGNSGTAPGHTGNSPGQTGTAPGQTGTNPGNSSTAPGHTGTNPGNTGTNPGNSGTAPGHTANTPGQTGTNPGNSGHDKKVDSDG